MVRFNFITLKSSSHRRTKKNNAENPKSGRFGSTVKGVSWYNNVSMDDRRCSSNLKFKVKTKIKKKPVFLYSKEGMIYI